MFYLIQTIFESQLILKSLKLYKMIYGDESTWNVVEEAVNEKYLGNIEHSIICLLS